MLEDIVANLANHAETGQIPKPYRRGSWRPIGHMRPSSPLLDSVRDQFEGNKSQLREDFMAISSPRPFPSTRLRSTGEGFYARVPESRAVVSAERSPLRRGLPGGTVEAEGSLYWRTSDIGRAIKGLSGTLCNELCAEG